MRAAAAAAAVALLALSPAACKRRPKAPKASGAPAAAAAIAASPTEAGLSLPAASEPLPAWTQEPAHFSRRGSRRVAVSVGRADAGGLALSRAAAEGRARAELARLLQGLPTGSEVSGPVVGARIRRTYTAKDGSVYVELEAPAAPPARPGAR